MKSMCIMTCLFMLLVVLVCDDITYVTVLIIVLCYLCFSSVKMVCAQRRRRESKVVHTHRVCGAVRCVCVCVLCRSEVKFRKVWLKYHF